MNIFRTSESPKVCAHVLSDQHVIKMALETTQILCTALRLNGCTDHSLYKSTHVGHPCVKWAAQSLASALWLHEHGLELCAEYTLRFGKTHACEAKLTQLWPLLIKSIPDVEASEPPKCVPDDLRSLDLHAAYQESLRRKYGTQKPRWRVKHCIEGLALYERSA